MRPIITTSWTPRTSPNTTYERGEIIPVSFNRTDITFDSTEYTWDIISELKVRDIQTEYNTPRLGYKVRDLMNNFVFDLA